MHYTGMAAMRLDALVMYNIAPWLLSIVNAIVCSTIAIWLVFRLGGTSVLSKVLAALVMGVAISGMHDTGMYATVCVSTGQTAAAAIGLDPVPLAAAIAVVTLLIMSMALTVSLQSQLMSNALRLLKCDEMQGYLFSKPVPLAQIEVMLANQQAVPRLSDASAAQGASIGHGRRFVRPQS